METIWKIKNSTIHIYTALIHSITLLLALTLLGACSPAEQSATDWALAGEAEFDQGELEKVRRIGMSRCGLW